MSGDDKTISSSTNEMGSKESMPQTTDNTTTTIKPTTTSTNDGEDSATESLPPQEESSIEEPHDRSDGSDSGLGELLEARSVNDATIVGLDGSDSETFEIPSTSNLEEQSAKTIDAILDEAQKKKGNLKRKNSSSSETGNEPKCKKKRGISFDSVTVYYFPRAQGFTCVPSQGGSTLGMTSQHTHLRKFSIAEHASEQRRIHRQLLQQLHSEKHVSNGTAVSSSDDSDSEEEPSDQSDGEQDLDNYNFLQPVPTRQRRLLLRAAGVRKIDSMEKDECKDIRTSREFCGCGCKNYCDPDTCSCSQAGIKCQVDRLNFPCGCSKEYCGNSSGRIEFNPVRVRTHFIHTIMRLELEKKQEIEDENAGKNDGDGNWMVNERLTGGYQRQENDELSTKIIALYNANKAESRLHNGNFTNLHYGAPGEGPGSMQPTSFGELPTREDSLDLYTYREDCYQDQANRTERKTPHFSPAGQGFHFPDPRFADVGFPGTPYAAAAAAAPNQYPPSSSSYQSTGFGDFAAPAFHPYGNVYTEFGGKPPLEDNASFQQQQQGGGFDEGGFTEEVKENQYTSLTSVGTNKIESFSELLHGRYGYGGYEDAGEGYAMAATTSQDQTDNGCSENGEKYENGNENSGGNDDCDENFGEIIKKSMVETVSA